MGKFVIRGKHLGAFFRDKFAIIQEYNEDHPVLSKAWVGIFFVVVSFIGFWLALRNINQTAFPNQDPTPNAVSVLILGMMFYGVLAAIIYRLVGPEKLNAYMDKIKGVNQPGTAQYMQRKEINDFFSSDYQTDGIFLGTYRRKPVILPAAKTANKNVCIVGASGSGKSATKIRNDLFQAVINGRSIIVTDPKGELTRDFRLFFQKKGYITRVYNLVDMRYSDRFNLLDMVKDDLDTETFCNVLMSNTASGAAEEDQFWFNAESNLLRALVLLVVNDERRPHGKTMQSLYDLLASGSIDALGANFKLLAHDHPASIPWRVFTGQEPKVQSGALSGLGVRLRLFQNKMVCALTAHTDIDLELPGKMKCAYFVIIPDNDRTFDFLSATFFAFLFKKLTAFADQQPDGRLLVPVSFELDEIRNIGKIPYFDTVMATLRSREMDVTMALQSLEQLKELYPDGWETIAFDCCDTMMVMGAKGNSTTQYISEMAGISIREGKSFRRNAGNPLDLGQYTVQDTDRALINSDEVRRMSRSEALVIHSNLNTLKVDKLFFKNHFLFPELIISPVQKYAPAWSEAYRKPVITNYGEEIKDPGIQEARESDTASGPNSEREAIPPQESGGNTSRPGKSKKASKPGTTFLRM